MLRAALLLLALASASAAATVFDVDDRITAPPSANLAPVGIVTGGLNVAYGSGFLIDACTVLTVRHVAGPVVQAVGERLRFRSGRLSSEGVVVAAGPFQTGPTESRSIVADWMIVRLRHCLGRKLGFLRLSTVADAFAARPDARIEDAGFPRDRAIAAGLTVDPDCRVLWVGGGRIAHDCATLPGNSGGPLLARDSVGWVAIGINAAGWDRAAAEPFRASEANMAIDIGALLTEICSVIGRETNKALCTLASG